jgi:hypothetical protein
VQYVRHLAANEAACTITTAAWGTADEMGRMPALQLFIHLGRRLCTAAFEAIGFGEEAAVPFRHVCGRFFLNASTASVLLWSFGRAITCENAQALCCISEAVARRGHAGSRVLPVRVARDAK